MKLILILFIKTDNIQFPHYCGSKSEYYNITRILKNK